MNNDDQDERLKSISIQLQLKVSKLLIVIATVFFITYIFVQVLIVFSSLNNLSKSQFTYLNSLGSKMAFEKKRDWVNIMNFLDSSSKLLKYAVLDNKNSNQNCNQTSYVCGNSNSTNYAIFDSLIQFIRSNSGILQQTNLASVFLLNDQNRVNLNRTYLGLKESQQSTNYSSLLTNINNISGNLYYYNQNQVNQSTGLGVICSKMSTVPNVAICISRYTLQAFKAFQAQNLFMILNEKQCRSLLTSNYLVEAISDNLKALPAVTIQDVSRCLQNFPFNLGKYLNTSQSLEIKCKHDDGYILNLFGPTMMLVSYKITLDLQVTTNKYYQTMRNNKQAKYLFISSNSTFYTNQKKIVAASLTKIRQSGYILLLGLLGMRIFVLHYSNNIIKDILLYSIQIISTACQFLKNKQEKEFYRYLSRQTPSILKFLVGYFNQFMWIHKLRKFKGKFKYKKILLEGLQLFDEQRYIPVLKFIYIELIAIQSQLVQKLFKIKDLPHKKRQMGSKCEDAQQRHIQPIIVNNEQRVNKRRNANYKLLDPDDDVLMKNISISFRGNRGVRFSNDIQTIQIDDGPILRKTKFGDQSMVSCQTIKNDLSEAENESIKRSDFNKQSLKSLKSEEQSYTSLVDISRGFKKKDSSTKTRSLESIHVDLDNLKLDEQLEEDQLQVDQESEQEQIYNMNREQITEMISGTYQKVIDYYEKLFNLLAKKMENQTEDEIPELANYLYVLTIRKYEKLHELLLFESQDQMEKRKKKRGIVDFQDLKNLERNYNHYLSNQLTQQAEVLRQGILQAQHQPISLSNLQDIYCKSNVKKIRIAARHLLARAAEESQPHLDLVIARNVYANLKEEKTSNTVKQESLAIFMRNLQRYPNFWQELQELKMATQFYNTKNKKFYFLASIPSVKIFTPVLSKFYQLLDNFDIFNIYNLEDDTFQAVENETSENIIAKTRRKCMSDKLKYLMDLEGFIELFNPASEKMKQVHERGASSVKTIIKKRIYEKEFHEILLTIQNDDVDYSKYVVIFLGDEHNISSSDTEESSSSANHRPYQQKIHVDITKIISKGFLHFILVGFSLDSYPSKYGRLKKYIKLSPELFEVELSTKQQQENLKRLEKYLK